MSNLLQSTQLIDVNTGNWLLNVLSHQHEVGATFGGRGKGPICQSPELSRNGPGAGWRQAAASRELHMFSALFLPFPLQLGTAVTHQGWQWWGVFALGADLHRTPSALTLLLHLLFAAHHSHPVGEHTAEW